MYGYTQEQLQKKLKISIIIGALLAFVFAALGLFEAKNSDAFTAGEMLKSIGALAVLIIAQFLGVSWTIMSLTLNFKKILKGCILPVPILSACIEMVKGQIMAIKVIIFLIKNKKTNEQN